MPLLISGGAVTEETIAMTQKAVDRLGVVQQVVSRQLRQREAVHQPVSYTHLTLPTMYCV